MGRERKGLRGVLLLLLFEEEEARFLPDGRSEAVRLASLED